MDMKITGLMLPVRYPTKSPQRHGSILLCFADKPEKFDKDVPDSIRNAWQKSVQLYHKNNIYGDHDFWVPVRSPFGWNVPVLTKSNNTSGLPLIGANPTTSVDNENLQFIPCSEANLDLIIRLQDYPFYIEIGARAFYLHVLHYGKYYKIPSQRHIRQPRFGTANLPVITLATDSRPMHFANLHDIPWPEIAQQLGTPVEQRLGNKPLVSKWAA